MQQAVEVIFDAFEPTFFSGQSDGVRRPLLRAHYAGNILEASLKAYLQAKSITFNDETATLSDLWPLVRGDIGLNPKDLENKDLKKIASGLNSIVDGTMYLRNKKSGAHGRTEEQTKEIALRPRHARLVVHSALMFNYKKRHVELGDGIEAQEEFKGKYGTPSSVTLPE